MIIVLLLLVVAIVGIGVMAFGHVDGGYALLAWGGWSVETSLVALILAIIVVVAIGYGLARIGRGGLHLPRKMRQRRMRRAQQAFDAGILKLLQGHWKAAERLLLRHADAREKPYLNYLGAARAAQHLGASDRRDHYLGLAASSAPGEEVKQAALSARAHLQHERGEYAALADTARSLHELDPDNPQAVQLLAEALADKGEWAEVGTLLESSPAQNIDPQLRDPLRQRALQAALDSAIANHQIEALKRAWSGAGDLAKQPGLRLRYVEGLARLVDAREAEAVIEPLLDHDWDADLADVYSRLQGGDAKSRLAKAQSWLRLYGERPELLAIAGRACLSLERWDEARTHLEALLRLAPSPQACLDLARLAEATQHAEDAARYYREGLTTAVNTTEHHEARLK